MLVAFVLAVRRNLPPELARGLRLGVHHNVRCPGIKGAHNRVEVPWRYALGSARRRWELIAKGQVNHIGGM